MRLKRILWIAVLAISIASGCSANRSSWNPLRGENDRDNIAPQREHEYEPRLYDGERELQEPSSLLPSAPAPSGEPVPAPPALGVSRVKSVSWFSGLGAHLRGKETAARCVDEPSFEIGACSPIDGCTSEHEIGCESTPRASRIRQNDCDGAESVRVGPGRSIRNSLGKLFRHKRSVPCPSECAEANGAECCDSAEVLCDELSQRSRHDCGEELSLQGRFTPLRDHSVAVVDSCAEESACASEEFTQGHSVMTVTPKPRKNCLADPLQEPFTPEVLPAPNADRNGAPPASVPAVPFPAPQEIPVPQLPPLVPGIPIDQGSSVRFIEPPAWPRNRATVNKNGTKARQAAQHSPRQQSFGSQGELPELVPGRRI